MKIPPRVHQAAAEHPYPLLFATISGAHLYGFPSDDSDWDLRGCHLLPAAEVLGLRAARETIEVERKEPGFELDLVTHDAEKFFRMMLKKNGYVLEQLYSPLIVAGGELHEELKELGRGCITRHHVHHYLGFARNQLELFGKDDPPRVKPLLYVFRVLLTGIHLMRTGVIEADLRRLDAEYAIPGLDELIQRKVSGAERETLSTEGLATYHAQVEALMARLEREGEHSQLPEAPSAQDALSDLLVRLRLGGGGKR